MFFSLAASPLKKNLDYFFKIYVNVSESQPMISVLQNREAGKSLHHLQMKKLKGEGHSHDVS